VHLEKQWVDIFIHSAYKVHQLARRENFCRVLGISWTVA